MIKRKGWYTEGKGKQDKKERIRVGKERKKRSVRLPFRF